MRRETVSNYIMRRQWQIGQCHPSALFCVCWFSHCTPASRHSICLHTQPLVFSSLSLLFLSFDLSLLLFCTRTVRVVWGRFSLGLSLRLSCWLPWSKYKTAKTKSKHLKQILVAGWFGLFSKISYWVWNREVQWFISFLEITNFDVNLYENYKNTRKSYVGCMWHVIKGFCIQYVHS